MKNYIELEEISRDIPFIKLALTKKPVNAKNIDELKNCFGDYFTFENLVSNNQIHSDIVKIVSNENKNKKDNADALITNLKNTPLLVFTADCVPVIFIDKIKKIIGVAHAGWRGTYSEITKKTIQKMNEVYNSNPEDIVCIIGPSIGSCCYEVSKELYSSFKDKFKNSKDVCLIKNNKYFLDLWEVNKYSAIMSGVKQSNILSLDICTNCNSNEFYSYRADNKTYKRIGMIIELI